VPSNHCHEARSNLEIAIEQRVLVEIAHSIGNGNEVANNLFGLEMYIHTIEQLAYQSTTNEWN
jgi:hypothetical protein